jgi:hypothetical protein
MEEIWNKNGHVTLFRLLVKLLRIIINCSREILHTLEEILNIIELNDDTETTRQQAVVVYNAVTENNVLIPHIIDPSEKDENDISDPISCQEVICDDVIDLWDDNVEPRIEPMIKILNQGSMVVERRRRYLQLARLFNM